MTRPLRPNLPPELEAWLSYYDDIGLAPFFLSRKQSSPATRPAKPSAKPAAIPAPAPPPPAPRIAPPAPPVIAATPSVSLFASVERVAGDSLEKIRADIGDCTRCKLCEKRNKIVFGDGNARADLVFVGEGPGRDEDAQGLPFVGRAGQLLNQMIEAMGLKRDQVYIANVVKCRPPENRTPEKDEIATCSPFLLRQLDVLQPKAVVTLGAVAAQTLLATTQSMSKFRGQWFDWKGTRLMPTYHPAYLLRNPNAKPDVWKDLQKVMAFLGLTAPPKKK